MDRIIRIFRSLFHRGNLSISTQKQPQSKEAAGDEDHGIFTPDTFFTATPGYPGEYQTPGRLNADSKLGRALDEKDIIVAKEVEVNWSGRGQHVEYKAKDVVPLEVEKVLGHSSTALVESVRCRRIRLARKSMRYRRGTKLEDLVEEVAHLHRLRHAHIIQLVGSYLQKDKFAILLYPAAHYDLSEFMERENIFFNSSLSESIAQSLSRFFLCLAHAIDYVHGQGVKHMDIKPTNILVFRPRGSHSRTVLLADFGISKRFVPTDDSQTDGPTGVTRRWCSPEAAAQMSRGRASDIFSLGCVFIEMFTVLKETHPSELQAYLSQDGSPDSFHLNLPRVRRWIDKMKDIKPQAAKWTDYDLWTNSPHMTDELVKMIKSMVEEIPTRRPKSSEILASCDLLVKRRDGFVASRSHNNLCCVEGPLQYEILEEARNELQLFKRLGGYEANR